MRQPVNTQFASSRPYLPARFCGHSYPYLEIHFQTSQHTAKSMGFTCNGTNLFSTSFPFSPRHEPKIFHGTFFSLWRRPHTLDVNNPLIWLRQADILSYCLPFPARSPILIHLVDNPVLQVNPPGIVVLQTPPGCLTGRWILEWILRNQVQQHPCPLLQACFLQTSLVSGCFRTESDQIHMPSLLPTTSFLSGRSCPSAILPG